MPLLQSILQLAQIVQIQGSRRCRRYSMQHDCLACNMQVHSHRASPYAFGPSGLLAAAAGAQLSTGLPVAFVVLPAAEPDSFLFLGSGSALLGSTLEAFLAKGCPVGKLHASSVPLPVACAPSELPSATLSANKPEGRKGIGLMTVKTTSFALQQSVSASGRRTHNSCEHNPEGYVCRHAYLCRASSTYMLWGAGCMPASHAVFCRQVTSVRNIQCEGSKSDDCI